ncbi:MAG TPA: Chromate resistance protein ChrB [Candidatus Limnocylindrales bacterium]|nr:Chromate resistance protein ChrB [Candidatus Limnocylindrales bacterium]
MARADSWVLLSYRLPRDPSTPRITVWRNLKRLGVAQLADALVALPADARTREQLEWIAEQVAGFGGEASIWLARPASLALHGQVVSAMVAARTEEYREVLHEAAEAAGLEERERRRVAARLNAKLRRIKRRDFFPPAERDQAHAAVHALATAADVTPGAGRAPR